MHGQADSCKTLKIFSQILSICFWIKQVTHRLFKVSPDEEDLSYGTGQFPSLILVFPVLPCLCLSVCFICVGVCVSLGVALLAPGSTLLSAISSSPLPVF